MNDQYAFVVIYDGPGDGAPNPQDLLKTTLILKLTQNDNIVLSRVIAANCSKSRMFKISWIYTYPSYESCLDFWSGKKNLIASDIFLDIDENLEQLMQRNIEHLV